MNINPTTLKIILIILLILILYKGVSFSKGTETEPEPKYKHLINKLPTDLKSKSENDIKYEATTNLSECVKACNENKNCKGYILSVDPESAKTKCKISKLINEDDLEEIDLSPNINLKSYTKKEDGTFEEETLKISKLGEVSKKNGIGKRYLDNEENCKEECTNNKKCLQYFTFKDKSCLVMNDLDIQTQEFIDMEETIIKTIAPSLHIFVKE